MTKKRAKSTAKSVENEPIKVVAEVAPTEQVAAAEVAPIAAAPVADAPIADTPILSASMTDRLRAAAQVFTWADLVFLLIVALAAVLRLAWLGDVPLSPNEAEAALPVWQVWHGGVTSPIGSPAYFTLTALLMPALGDSDALMRLIPALVGVAMVALVWYLKQQLGIIGALAATVFLALSPLALSVSRTAGGDSLALFALMLLFVSAMRLSAAESEEAHRPWAIALGAGLGLGLTSSPLFYTGLLPLALLWWWFAGIETDEEAEEAPWPFARLWPYRKSIGLAALIAATVLGTTLLLYPLGIGAALGLVPAWLSRFGLPAAGDAAATSSLLAALRYEPALFLLGFPIMIWSMWRRPPLGLMLSFWMVTILLIMFIQPGHVTNAAALVVPGYLLLGFAVGQAVRGLVGDRGRVVAAVAGGSLLAGAALVISLGRYARVPIGPEQTAYLLLAGLVAIGAVILLFLTSLSDERVAITGGFLGLAALLLFLQWGAAWQLATVGANDPRERWVPIGTDGEIRLFTETLRRVSLQASNSEYDIDIFSTVDSPALRWYLRDYRFAQFGPSLPIDTSNSVLITPPTTELRLPSDYVGDDFGWLLRESEAPAPLNVAELLRWWLFRESSAPVPGERLVLWLRADLINRP